MNVNFSAGAGLIIIGMFLFILSVPGGPEIIGELLGRQVRSAWRKSTKYVFFFVGFFLVLLGLFIILQEANIVEKIFGTAEASTENQQTQSIILAYPKLTSSDYGNLLYEDNFETDTGIWSLEKESQIKNGMLILNSQAATFPNWNTKYSDFIFETEFQFIGPLHNGWNAFSAYLRFAKPNCSGVSENCSDQIAVSSDGIIAAWRPNGTYNYEQLLASTKVPDFSPEVINKLTVIVNGNEFRIFLNDIFIRSFNDPTYKSGIVVLGADDIPVAVHYVHIFAIP